MTDAMAPKIREMLRQIETAGPPSDAELRHAEQVLAEHREAEQRREAQRVRDARRDRARAELPARYQHIAWSDLDGAPPQHARAIQAAQAWCKLAIDGRATNLLLIGKTGTGKTSIACAAMLDVLSAGLSARYFTEAQLVRHIREGYDERGAPDRMAALAALDVLVLDEIGIADGDPSKRLALLNEVIDVRYRASRPTVAISNLPASAKAKGTLTLADYLSERVVGRLFEDAVYLACDWPGYRRMPT